MSLQALLDHGLALDRPPRLTATDIASWLRLSQCDRFLRFQLEYRNERRTDASSFLEELDVAPQPLPSLLTGSGAAFLVLESRDHAEARGATILAALGTIAESRVRRGQNAATDIAATFDRALGGVHPDMIVSGASGVGPAVALEKAALASSAAAPVRAFSSMTGFMKEVQFPFAVALAALAVSSGRAFSPVGSAEAPAPASIGTVLAETVGHLRGEGAVLVSRP